MEITKLYESWCKNAVEDQDLIAELDRPLRDLQTMLSTSTARVLSLFHMTAVSKPTSS